MSNKHVTITRVIQEQPPYSGTFQGDNGPFNFTIRKWLCDVEIDGHAVPSVEVQTSTAKIAEQIRDGWSGECEPKEYQGKTSWKIVKPQREGYAPSGGGGGGKKSSYVPPTKYTVEEYNALYKQALNEGSTAVTQMNQFTGDLAAGEKADVVCRLASTWLIGAQKAGVKV